MEKLEYGYKLVPFNQKKKKKKKKKIAMCIHSTGYYGILSLSNGNDTR